MRGVFGVELMPREKMVTVRLSEDEFRLLRLTLHACLEAGGDVTIYIPLLQRMEEAKGRFDKRRTQEVDDE